LIRPHRESLAPTHLALIEYSLLRNSPFNEGEIGASILPARRPQGQPRAMSA
jgi:hypothetical protein